MKTHEDEDEETRALGKRGRPHEDEDGHTMAEKKSKKDGQGSLWAAAVSPATGNAAKFLEAFDMSDDEA